MQRGERGKTSRYAQFNRAVTRAQGEAKRWYLDQIRKVVEKPQVERKVIRKPKVVMEDDGTGKQVERRTLEIVLVEEKEKPYDPRVLVELLGRRYPDDYGRVRPGGGGAPPQDEKEPVNLIFDDGEGDPNKEQDEVLDEDGEVVQPEGVPAGVAKPEGDGVE